VLLDSRGARVLEPVLLDPEGCRIVCIDLYVLAMPCLRPGPCDARALVNQLQDDLVAITKNHCEQSHA
jgi:hypothetical protein